MAHARQQIRDHIVTTLTGLTTTGANVFNTRVYPSGDNKLPGLTIFTRRDTLVTDGDTIGKRQKWDLTVEIEARSKPALDDDDLDEQLDTICAEVQAAIMADVTLGGRVIYAEIDDVEMDHTDALERPTGIARISCRCRYAILAEQPETLIYLGG